MCDKNLNSHVGRQIACDNIHKEKRILDERKDQWSTPSFFKLDIYILSIAIRMWLFDEQLSKWYVVICPNF
jgi:hypothetical protein